MSEVQVKQNHIHILDVQYVGVQVLMRFVVLLFQLVGTVETGNCINPTCSNLGKTTSVNLFGCSNCGGRVTVSICDTCGNRYRHGMTKMTKHSDCNNCNGKGYVIVGTTCSTCKGSSKMNHSDCNGCGYTQKPYNCSSHNERYSHYYCTSSSRHGKNVTQYHK